MGKRLLAGVLALGLLLGGCSADRGSSSSSEGTFQGLEFSEQAQEKMRAQALLFVESYPFSFNSVDELDYREIGFNSLFWIAASADIYQLRMDDDGYFCIPKSTLQDFVWEHFGIKNYEYPISDNANYLPRYNPDQNTYLFYPARDGTNMEISIEKEEYQNLWVIYTLKLDFLNIETNEVMRTETIDYKFEIVPTDSGYTLRILSATNKEKEWEAQLASHSF